MSERDVTDCCLVLTTTAGLDEARELAGGILKARLAACVQIQDVRSWYWWQDEIQNDTECLLLIKTRTDRYADLEVFIQANHSYDTPEIVQLPITAGSAPYLAWLNRELATPEVGV